MKNLFGLILLLVVPTFASADAFSDLFKTTKYECFIIGQVENAEDGIFEINFPVEVKPNAGSHGGPEMTHNYKNHEIVVVADERWFGMAWWTGGKKIGESVTLSTETDAKSRVLILINPNNDDERLSLTCDLVVE